MIINAPTKGIVSDAVKDRIGGRLLELLKNHLEARNAQSSQRTERGFKKSNFYGDAAKASNYRVTPGGVRLAVSKDGFALQVLGGVVRPVNVNVKALTMPINPEADGKRARDQIWAGQLYFIPIHRGDVVGALARKHTGSNFGEFMYLLLRKAVIKGDRSLVPSEQEILGVINGTLDDVAREELDKKLGDTSAGGAIGGGK